MYLMTLKPTLQISDFNPFFSNSFERNSMICIQPIWHQHYCDIPVLLRCWCNRDSPKLLQIHPVPTNYHSVLPAVSIHFPITYLYCYTLFILPHNHHLPFAVVFTLCMLFLTLFTNNQHVAISLSLLVIHTLLFYFLVLLAMTWETT